MGEPAGWNQDPSGRHQYRYWDGMHWTDHVADDGRASLDPLATAEQTTATQEADPLLAEAREMIRRFSALLSGGDLRYVQLPEQAPCVGVGVPFSSADFVVVSASPSGDLVYVTCGLYKDVTGDRVSLLEACNNHNRDVPATPVFLHDARVGSDVLMQRSFPAKLLLGAPDIFLESVRSHPVIATQARGAFVARGVAGDARYRWDDEEDRRRLLIRSVL